MEVTDKGQKINKNDNVILAGEGEGEGGRRDLGNYRLVKPDLSP